VRCDNEHYVPAGFDHCRRCADGSGTTIVQARPTFLTLGEYVGRRDRLVLVDVVVIAVCGVLASGRSLAAAAAVGIAAFLVALAALRRVSRPGPESAPASVLHARRLTRLVMTPGLVVMLTALVAIAT